MAAVLSEEVAVAVAERRSDGSRGVFARNGVVKVVVVVVVWEQSIISSIVKQARQLVVAAAVASAVAVGSGRGFRHENL